MIVQELMTRFSGDSSGFRRSADEVRQELTRLSTEYNTNRRAISELQRQINSEVRELNALKTAMSQTGGGTEEQRQRCQELEQSINSATVTISQMQTAQTELRLRMSEVTAELRNQGEKTVDVSKSFSDFCSICKASFDVISKVSKALIDTTFNAAAMADTVCTLSAQTGISTKELQKYQYAQELVDVSLSDYTSGVAKATQVLKNYQSGNAEVVSVMDKLGVSIYDSTGALKDSNVVLNDIIEALGKVGDNAQQDIYAMTLLGDSATTYSTLINGGIGTLKSFGDELEKNGLIINDIQMQDLLNVSDGLDSIKSKAQSLTNVIGASSAPTVNELLEIIDEIIMNINDAVQDGELQPYINIITGMLKTLAKMLKDGINILIDWKDLIIGIGVAFTAWKVATTIQTMVEALKKAEIVQKAFNLVAEQNPYILIGSVVIGVIAGIVTKLKSATNETSIFSNAMKQLNDTVNDMTIETQTQISKLETLGDKYEELRTKANRTAEEEKQLLSIGKELKELAPNYINDLQDETGAYINLSNAIAQSTEELDKQLKLNVQKATVDKYASLVAELRIEYELAIDEAEDYFNEHADNYWSFQDGRKHAELESKWKSLKEDYDNAQKNYEHAMDEYYKNIGDISKDDKKDDKKIEISEIIDAYSNLENKLKIVTDAEEEFAEKGRLTSSTLSDIADKYPDLESSIKAYINGTKSEFDLLGELSKAYNNDYNNYSSAVKAKIGKSEELYSMLVNSNADIINTLKDQYQIDLTNYQTYNDAKYAIANKTLSKICSDWAKYYDAENDAYTTELNKLFATDPEKANAILNAVPEYRNLLSELEGKLTEFATAEKEISNSQTEDKTISKFDIANEAYKKLVNERIAMIEKLRDTQVNAIQDQIDAIDAEIKARERLKEDTSIQDEIDAINAKLKYAQIDDFTRYELEKQLKELYQQQEDIIFERNAEDTKNALNSQMEDIKNSAAESMRALNDAMTTASEFFSENKNGYKSASQIVNNNSKSANISIINNALTSEQIATAIVQKLYD